MAWRWDLVRSDAPLIQDGKGAAFAGRDQGTGVLTAERVEGANTVGAGDTFNAGLLHGLCRGEGLEDAVRIGLRLATEAVKQGRGAVGALGEVRSDIPR